MQKCILENRRKHNMDQEKVNAEIVILKKHIYK